LEVRGVSLRFGGVRALTDVSFGVKEGELIATAGVHKLETGQKVKPLQQQQASR